MTSAASNALQTVRSYANTACSIASQLYNGPEPDRVAHWCKGKDGTVLVQLSKCLPSEREARLSQLTDAFSRCPGENPSAPGTGIIFHRHSIYPTLSCGVSCGGDSNYENGPMWKIDASAGGTEPNMAELPGKFPEDTVNHDPESTSTASADTVYKAGDRNVRDQSIGDQSYGGSQVDLEKGPFWEMWKKDRSPIKQTRNTGV